MRKTLVVSAVVATLVAAVPAGAAPSDTVTRPNGLVYRYYTSYGYRFQPLLSFGALNQAVSAHRAPEVRRLATALLARGARSGGGLYWPYDFSFGGGPSSWTSGFTQAVAAQALARASVLLDDRRLRAAADGAFRGLRATLLIPIAGGSWVREYSYTDQVILNAQLESVLALESYARIAGTRAAQRVARDLERAARRLLPRFDLGCWGRYQLDGNRADLHYEAYHVDLLRRLAATHPQPIWRDAYERWSRCLP